MRVVVVGSRGFIGTALAKSLMRSGDDVICLSSSEEGGINPKTGLFEQSTGWADEADCFVHLSQSPALAAQPPDPAHGLAVNLVSAVQTAMEAIRVGASRLIYASSGSVYEPSFEPLTELSPLITDNWYAMSKVFAEQALRRFSGEIDICILRLFGVYGPKQQARLIPTLVNKISNQQAITLAPGSITDKNPSGFEISLTHVDDAVKIIEHIMLDGGCGTLNVAGDDVMSIKEISMILGERLSENPIFEIQENCRPGNLISDNSKLDQYYSGDKISFRDGIRDIIDAR